MYQSNRAKFEALRSIDSATFTGSYQALGSAFSNPVRILHIINKSDQNVTISTDGGVTDNIYVPANFFSLYDFGANKGTSSDALELPASMGLLIKGTAGTGLVYAMVVTAQTQLPTLPGV